MIAFLALITFFAAPLHQPAPNDSVKGNKIIRTDDLMNHLEIDFISFDRLSFTVYSSEYGYFGSQPVFIIDGLPVDISFFGMINPYHLPVAKGRIREKQKGSFFDNLTDSQSIRFESDEPEAGLSVYAGLNMSNESGEPGPWVFDPERVTPNIERFGPGIDFEIQLAGDRFYGRGQYRFHRQMNTNLSVERRMKSMMSLPDEREWNRAEAITHSGTLEAGYRTNSMLVRARTLLAHSEDLFYFQPLGREIPSKPGLHQTILSAEADFTENWSIKSYAQLTEKHIGFRRNRFAHDFDWKEQTWEIYSSLQRQTENKKLSFGSRYRSIVTDAPGIDKGSRPYLVFFADLRNQMNYDLTAVMGHSITIYSGRPAIRISAGLEHQSHSTRQMSAEITYSEKLPEFSNPAADLVRRGYDISERFGIPFEPIDSYGKSRQISTSINQTFMIHEHLDITAGLTHITHLALHIPFQPVRYSEIFHTLPGIYRLQDGQRGSRGQVDLKVNHRLDPHFTHRFRVFYSKTLSGGVRYRNYWDRTPDWWLQYSATYIPFRDIELQAQVRYRSGTAWNDFADLDGNMFRSFNVQYPYSSGTFTHTPPSHLNVNLSVAKWFWKQRFRIIMMGKNILNRDYYPHPIAVREGFTFSLKAELRF